MRMITLNDGTTYAVSQCGAAEGYLWITLTGSITMAEAVMVFGDPERVSHIHHEFDGNDIVDFDGFTELIRVEKRNGMTITLKAGGMV